MAFFVEGTRGIDVRFTERLAGMLSSMFLPESRIGGIGFGRNRVQPEGDGNLLFFIFDASKEFLSESCNGLLVVERVLVVHFASGEMARVAVRGKNGEHIFLIGHRSLF